MVGWPWLVPGPLAVDDLAELRGLLRSLSESFGLIALGDVQVGGIALDPFVVCAGLSDAGVGCGLGVVARVDGRRLPTVLGRELISLDHITAGSTGLVLLGEGLGALVAAVASRDLPHPVLVLLDPPLSTAKQWWMIDQVRNLIGQASFRSLDRLAQSVLGIGRHEIIEKNYIETLFKPPLRNHFLLTGDVALWPRREMTGPLPTSLGEEDVLRLEHAYGQSLPILRIPNAGFPLTLNAAPIVADVLKQLILQL